MKKSVLLGIAAVALFALSAYAGEFKQDPVSVQPPTDTKCWPGNWSYNYNWATVTTIPVKMRIPFYVHIMNQDPIWLVQWDCDKLVEAKNPAKDKDWPCFQGCNDSEVVCNFNIKLGVDFAPSPAGIAMADGRWGKKVNPDAITAPGGTTKFCVWAWNVDLLGQVANTDVDVGTLTIKVKPN